MEVTKENYIELMKTKTDSEIRAIFGITYRALNYLRKHWGITESNISFKMTKEEFEECRKMGMTIGDICDKYKVTRSEMRTKRQKLGIL
jgi:hypothetical protein